MKEDYITTKQDFFKETHAKWMFEAPTTDEEAIAYLHDGKDPDTYHSIDTLYKICREHDKIDILEAVKKVLQCYIGEKPS